MSQTTTQTTGDFATDAVFLPTQRSVTRPEQEARSVTTAAHDALGVGTPIPTASSARGLRSLLGRYARTQSADQIELRALRAEAARRANLDRQSDLSLAGAQLIRRLH